MKNNVSLTRFLDRNADRILLIASGLMVAFFISFLLVLAEASSAQAQTAVKCQGTDLISLYAKDDPEKLVKLRVDAEKIINGKSIFWKIEREGTEPSFLLGTMHMADARIAKLDGLRRNAFETSDTVIVENVEALDQDQASAALIQHKELTLYTDGTTLSDLLDPDTLEKLKAATQERGIPFSVAQIMRPWLIATSVAVPACELVSKQSGDPVLDRLIAEEAKTTGKALVGLETIEEQFSAMAGLPEDFHLEALRETLNMGDLAEDVIETMKLLYLNGEIGMIQPLTKVVSPSTSGSKDFDDFNTRLITDRNHVMAERSLTYLEKGNVFMAVGALHLPGEEGLVELLRRQGFSLSVAD